MTKGYFGNFGGQFVAETLMGPLEELERGYAEARQDPNFRAELEELWANFVGRPTPVTLLRRLSARLGGAQIYLKREDLAHTGAHKINNAIGQTLLAKRMGKPRVVAETGAGQHGVAVATACSLLGLECVIYMGKIDAERQAPNVQRMQLLGAELHLVETGTQTLKDAINEAIRDWITNVRHTYYLMGSVVGPHPFPTMVRDFQAVIGRESRRQILEMTQRLPDCVVACLGGGSNSLGIFSAFLEDQMVRLVGVEAGGIGLNKRGRHAAPLLVGSVGVLHGSNTYILQDEDGQILETHSLAPGLDYPGVGPEHSYLKEIGRVHYTTIDDDAALNAFQILAKTEGILPALESAHAVAEALKLAPQMRPDQIVLVNLSGRGDKDLATTIKAIAQAEARQEVVV